MVKREFQRINHQRANNSTMEIFVPRPRQRFHCLIELSNFFYSQEKTKVERFSVVVENIPENRDAPRVNPIDFSRSRELTTLFPDPSL